MHIGKDWPTPPWNEDDILMHIALGQTALMRTYVERQHQFGSHSQGTE